MTQNTTRSATRLSSGRARLRAFLSGVILYVIAFAIGAIDASSNANQIIVLFYDAIIVVASLLIALAIGMALKNVVVKIAVVAVATIILTVVSWATLFNLSGGLTF